MAGHIVLIGLSGSGKSTVGRALAARLARTLVDTDAAIVEQSGRTIADIFSHDGEPAFRALERAAVAAALESATPAVVALGGGAILDPESRARALDGNVIVRLDASVEILFERLRSGPGAEERPLVSGPDPLGRLRAMRDARAAAYSVAHYSVETGERGPDEIAAAIVALIGERSAASGPART